MNFERVRRLLVAELGPATACVFATIVAATAACDGGKNHEGTASASSSAAPTAALSPPSASAKAPPAPSGSAASYDPMASMFGSLAIELKNRPNVHPSVDDAFAALAKAGVGVKEPKQSLAKTYKASYCSHGVVASKDLSVLLCEYLDEAHAAAGLEESKKVFVGLSTRETLANKSLLLVTIFQDEKHPASTTAEQRKVVATFKSL